MAIKFQEILEIDALSDNEMLKSSNCFYAEIDDKFYRVPIEYLFKALGVFPLWKSTVSPASQNIGQLEHVQSALGNKNGLHILVGEDWRKQILTVEDNVVSEADKNTSDNKVLSAVALISLLNDYVKNSLTVAGLDLIDDITEDELRTALSVYPLITSSQEPTKETVGSKGQLYLCTTYDGTIYKHKLYYCSFANGNTYNWVCFYDSSKSTGSETNGANGKDGITPHIGENGNWFIGDTDTGQPSRGAQGEQGPQGKAGEDGEDGADGKTPVKGVDYWTVADKQEIINELTVSTSNVPTYWQAHLDTRVDNIREVMEKAGRNKSAFLFYSDAHWDSGSKYAPMLLNYLTVNTAINKTIYGGDVVSTEPTTDTLSDRTIMKYLWDWRTQIRNLRHYSVVGNHDDGNATNNIFSSDYVYSFLFAPEENNNIVRGADTYYYFDDSREQTRYLCLDTAYESAYTLSDAQAAFIKEVLKDTPENWHIIVVAHIWYMPDYDQYDVRPIPLTGLSDTATQIVTILDNYNARVDEFADCKAKIEFCIGGHVHRDYVEKTTGGIPIILCETASLNIRGEFTYTLGTITETAVSGIVADYDNDKVSVIRVGRGNSFEVELSTGTVTEIEDADEGTTEPTYTNVLDTVGYTEGIRLSGSDGGERTNEGSDTTGFIPCSGGDIIYLKNVQMVDSSTGTDYSGYISHFKEDESFINGYYYNTSVLGDEYSNYVLEVDENGYYTKLKVPAIIDLALIRITCLGIDETSIITVNEPIE